MQNEQIERNIELENIIPVTSRDRKLSLSLSLSRVSKSKIISRREIQKLTKENPPEFFYGSANLANRSRFISIANLKPPPTYNNPFVRAQPSSRGKKRKKKEKRQKELARRYLVRHCINIHRR